MPRQWFGLAYATVALLGVACGTLPTPHENFKLIIGGRVGHNVNVDRPSNKAVSVIALPNGHKELGFQYRGTCRYFYEVDGEGTILAWRFEGKESDCVIQP